MAAFRPRPSSDEAARVTAMAAELLEGLWGHAPTAPVSASQVRVLLVLERRDGINLRTLADFLGSTPPSTSRLCDRLRATGFIDREVSASDRREVRLGLTGPGRSFLADLRGRREEEVGAVLALMAPARRSALLEGLEAFGVAAAALVRTGADGRRAALPEAPETTAPAGAGRRSA